MRGTHGKAAAQRKTVLGLTGNIACGKSAVGAMLAALGAEVIDADLVVHEVMRLPEIVAAIAERFGAGVLAADGQVDRRKLGAVAFADARAMADLEGILYPRAVSQVANMAAASTAPVAVVDAIKLYEAGLAAQCDQVWVVTCPPEQQARRLVASRGLTEQEAWLRIGAQAPQSEKAARADVVIDNGGSPEQTREQVYAAYERLLARRH